jgi:hypothetical protein
MSTTGSKNYLGTRNDVAIEEEWVIPLPAEVTIVGNLITFAATALSNPGITTNMLAGQELWVLDNDAHTTLWKGVKLNVESNTTNTITLRETVEGVNLDAEFAGLGTDLGDAVAERMVVTQRGIRPGLVDITMYTFQGALGATGTGDYERYVLDEMFGIIDQTGLPDPVHDMEEKYAHGSASMPERHVEIYNRTSYDATTWPLSVVWGRYLTNCFGYVRDNASAFVGAGFDQEITADVYPGEQVVKCAATAALTVNDYVELGDHNGVALAGTDSEIRKVINIPDATHFVVDKPFRRLHVAAANMNATEVDPNCYERVFANAAYVQHTLDTVDSLPYSTIGVVKHGEHDDITVQDWKALYLGHVFPEATFASATNKELTIDMKSAGLYADLDPTSYTPATLDRTYLTDSSGNALQPLHFSRAYVTINDVRWHQAEEMNIGITRQLDTKWTHSYHESAAGTEADGLKGGHNPHEHIIGRANYTLNFMMPLSSKRLWNLLKARTKFSVGFVFEMLRSTTFTETWTFTAGDCAPTEASTQLPNEPTESQNIVAPPATLSLVIKDKTPHF